MSMFPSSLAAVRAAVEIQRELFEQDIPVRIGVHVGEVIVEPERLTGDAVNIASRIESFAVPGGVMCPTTPTTSSGAGPTSTSSAWDGSGSRTSGDPWSSSPSRPTASSSLTRTRWRARASASPACRTTCPTGRAAGRSGRRPGVTRRAGARAPGRHDHRPGRCREDAHRGRARPDACS